MVLQGVAAFGHIAPPVVVYAKQPTQQRGDRMLMCFPSEFTQYVFCVNAAGRKWDVSKRFRDFQSFERKVWTRRLEHVRISPKLRETAACTDVLRVRPRRTRTFAREELFFDE
jgi:hypothetical protein